MLLIGITLFLTTIFAALGSGEQDEQLAIADVSFLSSTPLSVQLSDEYITFPFPEDELSEQESQTLLERDITFGSYSHRYNQNHLRQWIFGNATNSFNISMSTCIKRNDVAGVYQFMNGSSSTVATAGDIYTDLGYGAALVKPEKMIAHALVNAQAAYDDISSFLLDSILCTSGNSFVQNELRRQLLFTSEGRVMTLLLQGTGGLLAYFVWNGIGLRFDNPGVKMFFGGIATLNLIIVVGLVEIFRQENIIGRWEAAFMGTVFVAKIRSLIQHARRSGRANQAAGPCLPTTQIAAAVAQAGSGSAPDQDLGVVASTDVAEIQAQCENTN